MLTPARRFPLRCVAVVGSLVLGLAPSVAAQAPSGPVRGKVLAPGGSPVVGALVQLVGRDDSVRTSATGVFALPRAPSGVEVLRIRALGYRLKFQEIRVVADSGWEGDILLEPAPQQLPEVEVNAPFGKPPEFAGTTRYDDFFRRRWLGFGTFRTRADIDHMGAFDVITVLGGIPGVSVSSTMNPYGATEVRFRMARCPGQPPNLALYVNGAKVPLFLKDGENKGSELSTLFRQQTVPSTCDDCVKLAEALSAVPIRDIQFVEFYRGPGQIPSDLDRGDSCAALVIWTR